MRNLWHRMMIALGYLPCDPVGDDHICLSLAEENIKWKHSYRLETFWTHRYTGTLNGVSVQVASQSCDWCEYPWVETEVWVDGVRLDADEHYKRILFQSASDAFERTAESERRSKVAEATTKMWAKPEEEVKS